MDTSSLRRAAAAAAISVGGLLWLSAILLMARTAQHSEPFSQLHPWILLINIADSSCCSGCSRPSSRSWCATGADT